MLVPAASLTFLTPLGLLLAAAAIVPLAGLLAGERRVRRARALLRLAPPGGARSRLVVLALAAVPFLLAVAAAQPAVRTLERGRVRTDAQAMFVIDTSRSMAARGAGATRLARAQAAAIRLRSAIPDVPAGVATLTDRVLPDLLPIRDAAAFDSTVRDTVGIERPPPQQVAVTATTLAALGDVATQGYFSPHAPRRVLVALTDGESRPFSPSAVARQLRSGPGVSLLLVHVSRRGERVYGPGGRPEAAYRPDRHSGDVLDSLAAASGGRAFGESEIGTAAHALKRAIGSGPTAERGSAPHTTALAPYIAAAAVVPLLLLIRRRNLA
jgi:hypothetical protein